MKTMDILVYTSPGCKWCTKTEKLLSVAKIPFTKKIMGVNASEEDLPKTADGYPVILVDNVYIGGIFDLAKLLVKEGLINSSMFKNE